jgi:hypothetical protein
VATALSFHALSLPLFVVVLAIPAVSVYELVRGRRSCWHSALHSARVARAVAAVIAVHHVARLFVWTLNGTLLHDYVRTSWTYAVLRSLGIAAG